MTSQRTIRPPDAPGPGTASWPALGTSAELAVTDPAALGVARAAVEGAIASIDLAASRFRDDSELSRLNAAGGEWVDVSEVFARVLRVALGAAQWSEGLVDPTVGKSVIDLGYDQSYADLPADGPSVRPIVGHVPGWRRIELDDRASRVRVPGGVFLDLGATAKALASDIAAARAAAEAGCGVLVSLGGDIAVAGQAPPDGWPVLVTDARAGQNRSGSAPVGQIVSVREGGMATSGTAARRWRRGGSQLHHLIDPRTGTSADSPWRTVSVTAPSCVEANVASTTAMIMGSPAPTWLAEHGFAARLVRSDGVVTYVGGWPAPVSQEGS